MINGIILDIDGVIVGEKIGFNSPSPHPNVLKALSEIHSKGIPIILCSAKPLWSMQDVIQGAHLNNPHITNAGALLIDPIDNKVISKHVIESSLVKEILKLCLDNNVYVEFYTSNDNYFISEKQKGDITKKHFLVLQKDPKVVPDLLEESFHQEVIRIMPIALNEKDKKRVDAFLVTYKNKLSISWGLHPVAAPLQFGIITALGSSKKEGAEVLIKSLGINFEDVLGIGDTTGDWSFIQLCGYGATLENGSKEIKELVKTKGDGKFFIGKSVDENGIVDIFKYFFGKY